MEIRYRLMDEKNFWLYNLYIEQGPLSHDQFRLTDNQDGPLATPTGVELNFDTKMGVFKCQLTQCDGSIVQFRVVDINPV